MSDFDFVEASENDNPFVEGGPVRSTKATVPVTLSLNIEDFFRVYYDNRLDEEVAEPSNPVMEIAVDAMVKRLSKDVGEAAKAEAVKMLHEQMRDVIRSAVEELLNGEYQPLNEFGRPTGAPTSLQEQLSKEVREWAGRSTGDTYNRPRETNMQKFIREQVAQALTSDLKEVLAENRAEIKRHMQAIAARLLAEEAAKR